MVIARNTTVVIVRILPDDIKALIELFDNITDSDDGNETE